MPIALIDSIRGAGLCPMCKRLHPCGMRAMRDQSCKPF
jgi:hypothetical protein